MMTLRQFVKNAEQIVAQQKGAMALKLQKGQVPNMETYHRQVGQAEGMDMAVGLFKDMLNQLEEADREDELPTMPPITGGEGK